jgi:hypothetical protein
MHPNELRKLLVEIFPDFGPYWDDPGNCFREDNGAFTLHGMFSEFTAYLREHHGSFNGEQIAALGRFVSDCMASKDEILDNAAATCFVENIANEECGRVLGRHLSGEARKYWQACGGR